MIQLCRAGEAIDLMLVDVIDQCIVQGKSDYRYTALSYVWGQIDTLALISKDGSILEGKGALDELRNEVAPVIQDAMSLTKQMEERYIWIDTLCIEQDNTKSKNVQIAQMDVVYQQALVTLVALSGENAFS